MILRARDSASLGGRAMMLNQTIRNHWLLGVIFMGMVPFSVAADAPAPQTARQALIEMFFNPTPGTLEKHLPEATRTAVKNAPPGSVAAMVNAFATLTGTLRSHGQQPQTFETGSTLFSFEDPQEHSKIDVMVERDELQTDEDQIELSFHASKDGETQTAGVKSRLILTMKQEVGIWRLNEITLAINVSLTDPALLKAMTTPMKPTFSTVDQAHVQAGANWSAMHGGNEASAISALRALMTAQVTYAALYPARGYTCSLSDLGGMGGTDRSEHQAMLLEPRLASGKKNDYRFALSGCDGTPASKFVVTAVPAESGMGMRTFCSDQSGVIRSSSDSDPDSCLSAGKPLR